jgi:TonB family protein
MADLTGAIIVAILSVTTPQQPPPRDPARPGAAAPLVAAPGLAGKEADLEAKIAASPTTLPLYYQLAQLQERRGAYAEAEATLLRAREAGPSDKGAAMIIAGFYSRRGMADQAIAAWETAAQLDGGNPQAHVMVANAYLEKMNKDKALVPAQQLTSLTEALAATDRALALDADNFPALSFKSTVLKQRATLETDPAQKQRLVAESEALRARAFEISKMRSGHAAESVSASPPPGGPAGVAGAMPVRVGGNIPSPTRLRDVKPIYPPEAQSAGIQGVVIIETTIGIDGRVSGARVLRSIPQLDEAALEAVRQWEFTPTLLNGVAVPVIMTVTVNFTNP